MFWEAWFTRQPIAQDGFALSDAYICVSCGWLQNHDTPCTHCTQSQVVSLAKRLDTLNFIINQQRESLRQVRKTHRNKEKAVVN